MASKVSASIVDKTPCSDVKDKTPVVGFIVSDKKRLSKEEVFNLTRQEQFDLIEKLGSSEMPRYEKDRVALILKLQ